MTTAENTGGRPVPQRTRYAAHPVAHRTQPPLPGHGHRTGEGPARGYLSTPDGERIANPDNRRTSQSSTLHHRKAASTRGTPTPESQALPEPRVGSRPVAAAAVGSPAVGNIRPPHGRVSPLPWLVAADGQPGLRPPGRTVSPVRALPGHATVRGSIRPADIRSDQAPPRSCHWLWSPMAPDPRRRP